MALVGGLLLNFVVMLLAFPIGRCLDRVHAIGPLVRITGLVVAAVAEVNWTVSVAASRAGGH